MNYARKDTSFEVDAVAKISEEKKKKEEEIIIKRGYSGLLITSGAIINYIFKKRSNIFHEKYL